MFVSCPSRTRSSALKGGLPLQRGLSPWVVLLPPLLPLAWHIYYCTEFPLKHNFWRCENANGWWQWMIRLNNDEIWMLNNMNNDAFLHLASRDGATTTGRLHNRTLCTQSLKPNISLRLKTILLLGDFFSRPSMASVWIFKGIYTAIEKNMWYYWN